MSSCFPWLPEEARRKYEAFEAAYGKRPFRKRRVSVAKGRQVCQKCELRMYQLRRIIERQELWDQFLRELGRDDYLRTMPEATKDALCERLRRSKSFTPEAEQNLRRWMKRIVRHDQPCKLGYGSLPRRLRMLGQLELRRAPKTPFRKVTPELAVRIRELASQEPKLSLRRIEQQLRQEGYDLSYATVRRALLDPLAGIPEYPSPRHVG